MRRGRNFFDDDMNMKVIKYSCIGIGILAVIVLGLLLYSKSLNDEVKEGTLSSEQFAELMNNTNSSNTTSVSTEMGKSVNEASNQLNSANTVNNANTTNATSNAVNLASSNTTNNTSNTSNNTVTNTTTNVANANADANSEGNQTNTTETAENKNLSFSMPVEGEIVKDFAQDNLIYSNTLEEWTTHTGIDIKADKTTVVKAAEAGTVKSIKNDPRYGLTIVVEHEGGFQTVYSNLLTSEFVVEGENVEKGQSLGTVGNTAAFEIADEPHLHFEILKDSVQVDPKLYLE